MFLYHKSVRVLVAGLRGPSYTGISDILIMEICFSFI